MVDFVKSANTAKRLIDKNGRTVTLVQFDQSPADNAKPYEGPTAPRANPDASVSVKAAFVPLSGASALGIRIEDVQLLKRTVELCLVGPGPTETRDFSKYDEIVDGGSNRKITFVEVLKPADTTVLYFFGIGE